MNCWAKNIHVMYKLDGKYIFLYMLDAHLVLDQLIHQLRHVIHARNLHPEEHAASGSRPDRQVANVPSQRVMQRGALGLVDALHRTDSSCQ